MLAAHFGGRVLSGVVLPLTVVLTTVACSVLAPQDDPDPAHLTERRVDVSLGFRWHGDVLPDVPAFEGLDEAGAFGVAFAHQRADDFLGFEVGIAGGYAEDDAVVDFPPFGLVDLDLQLSTTEFYGGVTKTFRIGQPLRPYVGAGLSFVLIQGDLSSSALGGSDSENDFVPAGYVHAGALLDVSKSIHLGLDGRALLGSDLDLDGLAVDADYLQLAFVVGWHF